MLGKSKDVIQGETNRSKLDAVDVTLKKIYMPRWIMKFYTDVDMATYVMHANDTPFLTTISENACHGTITIVNNLKWHALEFELKNVIRSHKVRGFSIVLLVVDMQFKSLTDRNLLGMAINYFSREDYLMKVERLHRLIK